MCWPTLEINQVAILARSFDQEAQRIRSKRVKVPNDGKIVRPAGDGAVYFAAHSRTTACASAESPSPTGPNRSAVLNFTETRSGSSPSVSASFARMASAIIFQLGAFQNHSGIHVRDLIALPATSSRA